MSGPIKVDLHVSAERGLGLLIGVNQSVNLYVHVERSTCRDPPKSADSLLIGVYQSADLHVRVERVYFSGPIKQPVDLRY